MPGVAVDAIVEADSWRLLEFSAHAYTPLANLNERSAAAKAFTNISKHLLHADDKLVHCWGTCCTTRASARQDIYRMRHRGDTCAFCPFHKSQFSAGIQAPQTLRADVRLAPCMSVTRAHNSAGAEKVPSFCVWSFLSIWTRSMLVTARAIVPWHSSCR